MVMMLEALSINVELHCINDYMLNINTLFKIHLLLVLRYVKHLSHRFLGMSC